MDNSMSQDAVTGSARLDSWKAIAGYLGRDERTVRRWERERGLPIRRVGGGRGASVFAYAADLDAWLKASPATALDKPLTAMSSAQAAANKPDRRVWPISVAAGVVVIAAVAWAARWVGAAPRAEDVRVVVNEQAVVATNPAGAELWRHVFPFDYQIGFSGYGNREQIVVGDRPGVFVATGLQIRRADKQHESGELTEFSPSGDVRRVFHFDDRVTFKQKDYGPPWGMTAFAVSDRSGTRRIAVAAHHLEWSASLLTILDGDFNRLGTYSQWGWIEAVHWLASDRVLVAGFDDVQNGGMLAIIDSAKPEAGLLKTIVMPRTEVNRVTLSPFNRAMVQLLPDRIVARTVEVPQGQSDAVDALYEFSLNLDFIRASYSQAYWDLHEALHAKGQIDHDRQHCPDREGPGRILIGGHGLEWKTLGLRSVGKQP
jgi:hypothetical protein